MKTRSPSRWSTEALLILGAALLATASLSALAGGLTVAPVRLGLAPGQRSTSISVGNAAAQAQTVQVEAFRWTRVDGEDRYEPGPELLVNPPLFELAPGASQLVRVGLRAPANEGAERAYRIFLQEVPRERPLGGAQLNMVLRIGIPVFIGVSGAAPALDWRLRSAGAGKVEIALANRGRAHARVFDLKLADAAAPGFAYVFPGETYRWTLDAPAGASTLGLSAQTDEGPVRVELPLSGG